MCDVCTTPSQVAVDAHRIAWFKRHAREESQEVAIRGHPYRPSTNRNVLLMCARRGVFFSHAWLTSECGRVGQGVLRNQRLELLLHAKHRDIAHR